MPTVINGIGTWYYGKRRIHRRKDTCEFCNRFGELESYDTTLFFVVFFVPVLPLTHQRILRQCPGCQRHRVLPLKQWEKSKADNIAALLEKLKQDPHSRENVLHGLSLAIGYQDAVLLDKLAPALAVDRTDDHEIQTLLGHAYAYFARWEEAQNAYLASLKVRDDPEIRRQLALVLLKQFRPDAAAPLLEDVVDNKESAEAGFVYLLIEAYQAEGRHREALEWIERRDAAFPELAALQDYRNQRRTSERYRDTNRKVRAATLAESSKAGYSEGSWTAYVPRLIPPLLAVGLLCWYLGAALWIGQARTVHVVNGTPQSYVAVVAGQEVQVPALGYRTVRVAEGKVPVEVRGARQPIEPLQVAVQSSFFLRPFVRHTFVLNPDRLAIVVRQKATYAEAPPAAPDPDAYVPHVGQPLYAFTSIDYEFQPLPQTVQIEKGHTATKTQVGLMEGVAPETRLVVVTQLLTEPQEQLDYAKRWLQFSPDDEFFLAWLGTQLKDDEMLAYLQTRLGERPLAVECHRAYQHFMEKNHPEKALRPEYEKLVADTNEDPNALYLLGRLLDVEEGEKLFRKAAAAQEPSGHALYALGHRALSSGEFGEAVGWLEKAVQRTPNSWQLQSEYWSALLAAQRYDQLLEVLQAQAYPRRPLMEDVLLRERVLVLGTRGDAVGAQRIIDEAVRQRQRPGNADPAAGADALRMELEEVLCASQNDAAGYLERAGKLPVPPRFELAFLRDKWTEAATASKGSEGEQGAIDHGLLYLAATQAGQKELADEQWRLLVQLLEKSDRFTQQFGTMLSGKQPLAVETVRRLPMRVRLKRVLLVVAAQRRPAERAPLLALADRLNFERDGTALCLQKVRAGVK